jgi:hypothetical protein
MIKATFYVYDVDPEKQNQDGIPRYYHHITFHVEEETITALNHKRDEIIKFHKGKFLRQEGEL